MEGSKKDFAPLLLETMRMQEFCSIAYMAYKEDVATKLNKLKVMAKELSHVL